MYGDTSKFKRDVAEYPEDNDGLGTLFSVLGAGAVALVTWLVTDRVKENQKQTELRQQAQAHNAQLNNLQRQLAGQQVAEDQARVQQAEMQLRAQQYQTQRDCAVTELKALRTDYQDLQKQAAQLRVNQHFANDEKSSTSDNPHRLMPASNEQKADSDDNRDTDDEIVIIAQT